MTNTHTTNTHTSNTHTTNTQTTNATPTTTSPRRRRTALLALGLAAGALAVPAGPVSADKAYHTYHAPLHAIGDDPLHVGFVNNIHAQGPVVYAMEYYHLVGARPNATYTALISFHIQDSDCSDAASFVLPSAEITTNAAGNGHGASPKFTPEDVSLLRGAEHGVNWIVVDETATPVFESGCSADFLD